MKKFFLVLAISIWLAAVVSPAFTTLAAAANLIANPSAEIADPANPQVPAYWQTGSWGSNSAVFSYTSTAEDGARALRIDLSNYTSGDAKWYFVPVMVTAGTRYDFSNFYQSNVPTSLVAQYQTSTGAISYANLADLPASATTWSQSSASFTIPAGVTQVTVFHAISANGWLITDNASLSSGSITPPVMVAGNLVPNPGVEQAGANPMAPNSWKTDTWGSNQPVFSYLSTGHSGNRSLQVKVSGYVSGDAKWDFVPVAVTGNQLYDFSDWYKSTGSTDVVAAVTSTTGSTSYIDLGSPAISSTWKQFKGVFTTPADAASVTVFHLVNGNGTLTTDDYTLAADATAVTDNVPNNSLETPSFTNSNLPSAWRSGGWGANTSSYSYLSTGHTGSHSVKVTTTAFTSGDAVWAYTPQPVSPGRYRFSDWYMSNRVSEVELQLIMSDGSIQYLTIGHPGVASSWFQFTNVVTLPSGVATATALHLIAGVGTLTTDDYSLKPAPIVPFNRPLVSVTFDDGWQSQYTNGLPVLSQYQLPATFYLVSSLLNSVGYMTTSQGLGLKAAGHELASHTVTHPDLTTLSDANLRTELAGSQSALQQLFGGSFNDFATPYGSYNQAVINAIKLYYHSHRSTDVGYNTKDFLDPYNLRVQNIDANTTEAQVDGWLAEAKAEGAWLILVYHEVNPVADPVNHPYSTTTANLAANFAAIKASGLAPVTISQGLGEVTAQ